jgi:hypothetical protein
VRALLATVLVTPALLASSPVRPATDELPSVPIDRTGAAASCPARSPLSNEDLEAARVAWRYFERNYHPATGLVSSVEGFPSTSVWDLGSSLFATVAAAELGLVDTATFDERIGAVLRTLATLPLFRGELPNKAYDAQTGAMTDYENNPAPQGTGWSAVDLGRLVSALRVLACLHPERKAAVARVLERWRWCGVLGNGVLHGALPTATGGVERFQEGRLGYEQYAAFAFAALGFDVSVARRFDHFVAHTEILGVAVPHDARDPHTFGAIDPVVTDPWVLIAFEHGLGPDGAPLAHRIFEVQKRRFKATGLATAAGEDHVDRAPWFVYDAIYAGGAAWRTITPSGADAPAFQELSTKGAFALAILYPDDPYAAVLARALAPARDPARGWYAGVYARGGLNRALTANTNGVILEALLFKALGPLQRTCARCGRQAWPDARTASLPGAGEACFPGTPAATAAAAVHAVAGVSSTGERLVRMSGTAFGGYRGTDGTIAGGVTTFWLGRGGFVRGGAEWTPNSPYGRFRFLWGIGWDDWRGNTFYAHVDNWGPIYPGEGFAVDRAEANVGYKLPRLCFSRSVCAAPLAGVTVPYTGGPQLGARMTLELGRALFVMGGFEWTVPHVFPGPPGTPEWRVVYGFGLWSWRAGSVYLTYHDWGPNYRYGNGVILMGVNWAL